MPKKKSSESIMRTSYWIPVAFNKAQEIVKEKAGKDLTFQIKEAILDYLTQNYKELLIANGIDLWKNDK